jgi:hypothetical protein
MGLKLEKNYFYSDLCSSKAYAHLKNCSEVYFDENNIIGLKVTVDTKHHTYLRDHVFGGDCFVPATMIMELFIEAACWFAKYHFKWDSYSYNLIGLEEIFIERAIAIKPDRALDICIQLVDVNKKADSKIMEMKILSKRINSCGKVIGTRLNATTHVLFSDKKHLESSVKIPDCRYKYYDLDPHIYYKSYFPSLGSLFQSGTGRFAINEEENILIGEYDCKNNEELFIEGQKSKFITSPLGYDSCLQYTVFLSRIIMMKGRLPVGAKKINIFKEHLPSSCYRVMVKCLKIDDEVMLANLWMFDCSGSVLMSAEEVAVQKSPFHKYGDRSEFEKLMIENQVDKIDW